MKYNIRMANEKDAKAIHDIYGVLVDTNEASLTLRFRSGKLKRCKKMKLKKLPYSLPLPRTCFQRQESSTETVQLQTRLLLNGFKAFGFVRDLFGSDDALEICRRMEYH